MKAKTMVMYASIVLVLPSHPMTNEPSERRAGSSTNKDLNIMPILQGREIGGTTWKLSLQELVPTGMLSRSEDPFSGTEAYNIGHPPLPLEELPLEDREIALFIRWYFNRADEVNTNSSYPVDSSDYLIHCGQIDPMDRHGGDFIQSLCRLTPLLQHRILRSHRLARKNGIVMQSFHDSWWRGERGYKHMMSITSLRERVEKYAARRQKRV